MKTLEITKKQIRNAQYIYEWAMDYVQRKTGEELKIEKQWNDRITDDYMYEETLSNDIYTFMIENAHTDAKKGEITVSRIFRLNGVTYNLDEELSKLQDIKDEVFFLKNFNVQPIEQYISNIVGFDVTFKKTVNEEKKTLTITTDNIVEHAGCCKAMLKELYIETFGTIGFSIDRESGEQFLFIPNIDFTYVHKTGGRNGSEIGKVKYLLDVKEYLGWNYETEKWELIK